MTRRTRGGLGFARGPSPPPRRPTFVFILKVYAQKGAVFLSLSQKQTSDGKSRVGFRRERHSVSKDTERSRQRAVVAAHGQSPAARTPHDAPHCRLRDKHSVSRVSLTGEKKKNSVSSISLFSSLKQHTSFQTNQRAHESAEDGAGWVPLGATRGGTSRMSSPRRARRRRPSRARVSRRRATTRPTAPRRPEPARERDALFKGLDTAERHLNAGIVRARRRSRPARSRSPSNHPAQTVRQCRRRGTPRRDCRYGHFGHRGAPTRRHRHRHRRPRRPGFPPRPSARPRRRARRRSSRARA